MMLGRSRQHSKGRSVFVLVPPNFDPSPDFYEARATAATLKSAIEAARPCRVVYLSTIGAQATQSNLLHSTPLSSKCWRVVDADYFSAARMVHGEL